MHLFLSAASGNAGFVPALERFNNVINGFIWGPAMCMVFVLVGIWLSIRTKWFQLFQAKLWWRATGASLFTDKRVRKTADQKAISQFQALSTALAATVGTGNIAGVATAIVSGGPGAVFWMWVSAFFGMITKFSEIALSMKYRYRNEKGEWQGGPMVFIERGMGKRFKWLAALFAIFATLASFGIGSAVQANSAAGALEEAFGFRPVNVGLVIAAVTAVVIIGGIQRIGKVTEILVPFMAILYTVGAVALIAMNAQHLGQAFGAIFAGAFRLQAVGGGVLGFTIAQAMRFGIARGVFTNEAGLGSSSIAHAASDTKEPVKQAMWGVFEVFADTLVICTLTALAVLTTGVHEAGLLDAAGAPLSGAALTSAAFASGFGRAGPVFLSVAMCLFAFATLVGWSYYGERTYEYLFGPKTTVVYKIMFLCTIVLGTATKLDLVWNISDTLNGLMAIPNLIGVVSLSGTVAALTKDYLRRCSITGAVLG
ncbi:MAG: alanine/glycine:cation symporter family protein [Oscillospiraceae bacterium]|jgi:AGCS family alanine or glycine:cation symporter